MGASPGSAGNEVQEIDTYLPSVPQRDTIIHSYGGGPPDDGGAGPISFARIATTNPRHGPGVG